MTETSDQVQPQPMRRRAAARLLVLDPENRLLLFRFAFSRGALAGRSHWALPGGGIEAGETPAEAAIRELLEETGISIEDAGAAIGERAFKMRLPSGEVIDGHETYFLVRTEQSEISRERWTPLEAEIIAEHRWWSLGELRTTAERIYPVTLLAMLERSGVA